MRNVFRLLPVVGLLACEPEPIPFFPPPDAAPVHDARVRPRLDAGRPVDAADPGDAMMGSPDAELPMCPEGPAVPPANARHAVVMAGRTTGWIAWVGDTCLYRATVDLNTGAVGPAETVVGVHAGDGEERLAGAMANGEAWAIWPRPDGRLFAYQVSANPPRAVDLELYAPLTTARIKRGDLLVVGHVAPDPGARVGWRILGSPRGPDVGALRLDPRGMPSPAAAANALGGWVLSFPSGLCARLAPRGEVVEDDHWPCAARVGAPILGENTRLFSIGAVGGDVLLWRGVPGGVARLPDAEPVPADDDEPDAALAGDAGPGDAAPDDAGTEDVGPEDVGAPDMGPAEPQPEDIVVLAEDAELVERLNPTSDGEVLLVRKGDALTLWLVTDTATWRVEDAEPANAWGLTVTGNNVHLVEWDPASAGPLARRVTRASGPEPPGFPSHLANADAFGPEDCSPLDLDGVGGPRNGLCCGDPEVLGKVTLPDGLSPVGPWFVGHDVDGPRVAMAVRPPLTGRADRAVVFSAPFAPEPETFAYIRSQWAEVERLRLFDRRDGATLALAEPVTQAPEPPAMPDGGLLDGGANLDGGAVADAGADGGPDGGGDAGPPPPEPLTLLWSYGALGTIATSEVPCRPVLAIGLRPANGAAARGRIYCDTAAFELTVAPAGDAVTPAYPPGEPLQWVKLRAGGVPDQILVARGPEHVLELWRDVPGGYEVLPLPEALADLPAGDRILPIHLPVVPDALPARLDGPRLDVLIPGVGWQRAASTSWPVEARLADDRPVAVTVANRVDPGDDPATNTGEYSVFVHHLVQGASYWGRQVPTTPRQIRAPNHQGFAIASGGALDRPLIYRAQGNATQDLPVIQLEGYRVNCYAPE